ncbi:kelch repeat protein [Toxoplasma gondii GAB2-2007-GAL-DOM2]|uniref:Kelch repeat-containing protein n=3 Tax=Toxoplasma gondii TaxID=5811 RepID=A0A2T6J3W4_TOXGO|nr:kelch repeat protein [Toxoplasma gondii GAB2-2007-GAL-DOM2]PUA92265.1 kelch repeat-containing protein [Toxoplasma gondii TgCATBr9]
MNRNLEEADEESDRETPPALPKTRVFRSNSSSGVGGVAATAPSDGSDSHGACSSGEKGPSKVQLLRQKIETQAAERQAARKSGAAAGFGAGGAARRSGGGKREVIYDPLQWLES